MSTFRHPIQDVGETFVDTFSPNGSLSDTAKRQIAEMKRAVDASSSSMNRITDKMNSVQVARYESAFREIRNNNNQ